MEYIHTLLNDYMGIDKLLDARVISVLIINIFLIIFSRRILRSVSHMDDQDSRFIFRLNIFRALNLLIIFAFGYYHVSEPVAGKGWGLKFASVLVILYLSYFSTYLIHHVIRLRYGKPREVNGEKQHLDTYNSRILNIFTTLIIFVMTLIAVVRILGFGSILEAGGVLGFIGVFLALTQSTWAPDILSGLIILNSGMVEVGDVIELGNDDCSIGVVHKTKVFHTEILNLLNNHRVMIKNSMLREYKINNLSKFASAKGLRERLFFNIDYAASEEKVRSMFLAAFEDAANSREIAIEYQYPLEIGISETGDYAVLWSVYYYTKDVRNIIKTRQQLREVILKTSKNFDISLATPQLHVIEKTTRKKPVNERNNQVAAKTNIPHKRDDKAES